MNSMDVRYPLSKQDVFVSNLDRLRETAPDVADAFRGLRVAADSYGTLEPKQREFSLLVGFAVTRNEGGFRVHCTRAKDAGATLEEIEQIVILQLGTSLGLVPVVEALSWAHDELAD
ncbi:carboxymuconolactone decarboxylase family protein [Rhodococcus sp. 15-725-2-2b]|nr:carboxymuconolactone decarboxylase family protein [Rhodococcus sp. 06-470-2]OZC64542.1 carboxymuconolactone decarboxylase family protein [Rhodococcus sp. 06-469-3-2]OZD51176.1 carboxymuconolactone decarboxylase family protein [Rhodococcus sp. 06-1477-1A]OZE32127.1 carboxymuconolactone decarboxylase family protein [Rhodococcus sp. 05-2254-5]OZE58088.1 carboxymuconolactone decarboxylase family protein [Rhodococcus sp. 05-2221-1B]OZE59550.1 carboxymuconolactone decarboxylase family protein [Rh